MYKCCFLVWLTGLNGGSSRDRDHSFFKDQPVTWLFSGPQLYFHKARVLMLCLQGDCLIWLMLTHWDSSLRYLSVRAATGLQHSASTAQWRCVFSLSASRIYISSPLFLFTSRVTVHNLQTSELLWWKQGQAISWIYHSQFPGGPGWICFHPGGFYLCFTAVSGFIKR